MPEFQTPRLCSPNQRGITPSENFGFGQTIVRFLLVFISFSINITISLPHSPLLREKKLLTFSFIHFMDLTRNHLASGPLLEFGDLKMSYFCLPSPWNEGCEARMGASKEPLQTLASSTCLAPQRMKRGKNK